MQHLQMGSPYESFMRDASNGQSEQMYYLIDLTTSLCELWIIDLMGKISSLKTYAYLRRQNDNLKSSKPNQISLYRKLKKV